MPKKAQIARFKQLFIIWNKPFEKEVPGFSASDQIDLIDWDAYVKEGQTYDENLADLANAYGRYAWSHVTRDKEIEERAEEKILKDIIENDNQQNEELAKKERLQQEALAETVVIEPEETKIPLNEWLIEKTDIGEKHTKEVEITFHTVKSKGNKYDFGRIQVTVPFEWVGLKAKVVVEVPKIE